MQDSKGILLITPPFTQLNTPYPATAYLKGFFNTKNIHVNQADLGIDVTLRIFSKAGLEQLFSETTNQIQGASQNIQLIHSQKSLYLSCIDSTIQFLQGKKDDLVSKICSRNFLPEANRFKQLSEIEWTFGDLTNKDKAKHFATLFLEDLADYIVETIDPHFGFSRYAEKLGLAASSFDEMYHEVTSQENFIDDFLLDELNQLVVDYNPKLIGISIPFPGNLYGALKCGQFIKNQYPHINVAMGGGYPNTELRSITDIRLFEFTDFVTLDDGEAPMEILWDHINGKRNSKSLKRTLLLEEGKVAYKNGAPEPDYPHSEIGTPDYEGLRLDTYISVIEVVNPMHRLWSDGRWNKLTLAHGCYWGKCTFCDVSLDYIGRYQPVKASILVDRIEEMVANTGENGFHFVDEAAPPALLRELSLELLRRKLKIRWWTNIRFEKNFSKGLTKLMAHAGCIAVTGGLEVASERLLKLINKGVTIEQVSQVTHNFRESNILVHAYLMYGFPTQTEQETIDSLEIVRQLFEQDLVQSAYWHRFSMTAHSPIGLEPEKFKVINEMPELGKFANNDLIHSDPTGADHGLYGEGLKKALYNYMYGVGFDIKLNEWFDSLVPESTLNPSLISSFVAQNEFKSQSGKERVLWLGPAPKVRATTNGHQTITFSTMQSSFHLKAPEKIGTWILELLNKASITGSKKVTYSQMESSFNELNAGYFLLFWNQEEMSSLKEAGLILI